MNIVVLVKEVPDTYSDPAIALETGLVDRGATDPVLDEICERALEVALRYADAHDDTEVTLLAMSPESATTSLRRGLAMGADEAILVTDEALLGADLGLTAQVLAAALQRIGFDLVLAGNASTDGATGVLPAMLAELLDVPNLTGLSAVNIDGEKVSGQLVTETAALSVSAPLPALVSITEALPDARFPHLKGIVGAKRKPLQTLTLADLGIDAQDMSIPRSIVIAASARPRRSRGTTIVDDGDAAGKLVEFLTSHRLA